MPAASSRSPSGCREMSSEVLGRHRGARAAAVHDSEPGAWPVTFVDVADRAGLHAPSIYGGVDRKRFIIETNGAGVAFVDYDNDGGPTRSC